SALISGGLTSPEHVGAFISTLHLPEQVPLHSPVAFISQLTEQEPLHWPLHCASTLPLHLPSQVPAHLPLAFLPSHLPSHLAPHSPLTSPPSQLTFASPDLILASHLAAQSMVASIEASHFGGL